MQGSASQTGTRGTGADDGTGDAQLASALRITLGRLVRRLRAEKSDAALSLTKSSALSTVERCGPLSPTALASLERVQPPSMSRVLADLVGLGLVQRVAHPSDRRQSVIEITEAGSTLLAAQRASRDAWLARALDRLDPAELEAIEVVLPVLERLIDS